MSKANIDDFLENFKDSGLTWVETGIDIENRRVFLEDEIDTRQTGIIIRAITKMVDDDQSEPIEVYINSPGGTCYDGFALYDALVSCPCEVHTIAIGQVMSMGTIVLLAGDKRLSFKNTRFMWHSVSADLDPDKISTLQSSLKDAEVLFEMMLNVYDERSKKDYNWWKKWIKHEDRYGNAEKAKELGFITDIV